MGQQKAKIKHSTLIADYCEGGYKDVDIEKKIASLKIKWVAGLFDENFHPWKIIPDLLFSDIGVIFHHNLQLSQQCILKTKNYPKFYQELVQTWADVGEKEPSNAFEVCNECLWNNRLITSNGESLYNRLYIAKGIIRVQDIVDQNGLLLLWSDAQEKYSLNNSLILNWQGLIKNIPIKWKACFPMTILNFLQLKAMAQQQTKLVLPLELHVRYS